MSSLDRWINDMIFLSCTVCCVIMHFSVLILFPGFKSLYVTMTTHLLSPKITNHQTHIYTDTHLSATSKLHPTVHPNCFHTSIRQATSLPLLSVLRLIFNKVSHCNPRSHLPHHSSFSEHYLISNHCYTYRNYSII